MTQKAGILRMFTKQWFQNEYIIGLALAVFGFAVYLRTLAPTVTFIDSGELASDVSMLGIAHPTGYPLFTLLGWLVVRLPFGWRTIFQLNVLAAAYCAAALFFFFRSFLLLLSQTSNGGKSPLDRSAKSLNVTLAAAATSTITLAFSSTYWSQALSIEVYSLHLLLLSLVFSFFLKSILGGDGLVDSEEKNTQSEASWYGFAFFLGLSFTNHMTTILLAPGIVYLFFATHTFSTQSWLKLFRAGVPFVLGLSVYLYLPIRAAENPVLNWGNPATLERFWWHVTGKQYRVWILSSAETAIRQLKYFLAGFPSEFGYLPLILALLGVIYLYKSKRTIFYFTLTLFLSCLLYSINYDIHDIDSYFLLAYVVTAVWIAFGASAFLEVGVRLRNVGLNILVCAGMGLAPLFLHYDEINESKNYTVEDYTKNMFDSFEKNALVLSYQWDYFVSPSYYFQLVERCRDDVVVIDKELLRRSWYLEQLEHQYPQLIENSRVEVEPFLKELYKFEHDLPYDRAVIEARFEKMIQSFLLKNEPTRPVYVTPEIEQEFTRGFQRVPSGLAYRLYQDTIHHEITPRDFAFQPITKRDKYSEAIRSLYASAYCNEGIYLTLSGKKEKAVEFFRKALGVIPRFPDALRWLKQVGVGF
jgi:hypothetical protein